MPEPRMIRSAWVWIAWLIPAVHSVGVPWLVYSIHFAPYFLAMSAPCLSTSTTYGMALVRGTEKMTLPLILDMSKAGAFNVNCGMTEAA